jgi:hypothetical protein
MSINQESESPGYTAAKHGTPTECGVLFFRGLVGGISPLHTLIRDSRSHFENQKRILSSESSLSNQAIFG